MFELVKDSCWRSQLPSHLHFYEVKGLFRLRSTISLRGGEPSYNLLVLWLSANHAAWF